MSENVNIRIGPLFEHLTVTFVILKLCKVIDWSWWWVLSPFLGSIVLSVILLLCAACRRR